MRMGGRPGAPRALAVPTGPLGSAGPPQTSLTIFSCILERLTENWLGTKRDAQTPRPSEGGEPVLHAPCDLESRLVGERAHTNITQRLGVKRRPPHSAFAPACAPLTAPALSSISRTCERRSPKR